MLTLSIDATYGVAATKHESIHSFFARVALLALSYPGPKTSVWDPEGSQQGLSQVSGSQFPFNFLSSVWSKRFCILRRPVPVADHLALSSNPHPARRFRPNHSSASHEMLRR